MENTRLVKNLNLLQRFLQKAAFDLKILVSMYWMPVMGLQAEVSFRGIESPQWTKEESNRKQS